MTTKKKTNRYEAYDEQEGELLWLLEHAQASLEPLDALEEERGKRIDVLQEHVALLLAEFAKLQRIWKKTIND
jgi:hypothetical protein